MSNAPAPGATSTSDQTRPTCVLVVDDEDAVRRLLRRVLEASGLTVLEASGGVQALDRMADAGGQIDLMLTDRWMPDLTGEQLAERIHRDHPTLPILLMSGDAPERSAGQLAEIGVRRVLAKPVGLQELRQVVAELLGRPMPAPPPVSPTFP